MRIDFRAPASAENLTHLFKGCSVEVAWQDKQVLTVEVLKEVYYVDTESMTVRTYDVRPVALRRARVLREPKDITDEFVMSLMQSRELRTLPQIEYFGPGEPLVRAIKCHRISLTAPNGAVTQFYMQEKAKSERKGN